MNNNKRCPHKTTLRDSGNTMVTLRLKVNVWQLYDKGSQNVAANTLLAHEPYLERRCVLVDEAQVRERIERTGVSDAKKRASYPLAKRAGARCAF